VLATTVTVVTEEGDVASGPVCSVRQPSSSNIVPKRITSRRVMNVPPVVYDMAGPRPIPVDG
jgi:hypothetical protein